MLGEKIHRNIFLFGSFALAFGMMMGTVPTSVPQIILLGNWLLEGNFVLKWQRLKNNRIFWSLVAVYFIHVAGLLYTDDLQAGLNDIRTKLPMAFLPVLFFSTKPFSLNEIRILFYFFLAGTICNTLWCISYTHLLHKNEGVRNASRFMSHIRLGLYLNIAIAVAVFLIRTAKTAAHKLLFVAFIVYFVFCMYALGLASGIINFVMLSVLFFCVLIYRQKNWVRFAFFLLLAGFIAAIVLYVGKVVSSQLRVNDTANNSMQEHTGWGTPYIHFEKDGQKENGNYVLINIQLEELKKQWNKRVPQDTFCYQPEYNLGRYEVLVRYLASMGLNKDSAAVARLTDQDIRNIQNNVFNYQYPGWSFLHRRLYEAVNEYDEFIHERHVNGHSGTMRLYFWKAALDAIDKHPVMGHGTGDVQGAMNAAYVQTNSPLSEEWFKRPHNQFLTVTVALGCIGLLVFVFSIFYPAIILRKDLPALYWTFLLVALVSFLVEDTLETQAGQTFYAFFNSLFITQAYWLRTGHNLRNTG